MTVNSLVSQRSVNASSLEEHEGYGAFVILVEEETGEIVDGKVIDGQYGYSWLLTEAEQNMFGRKFIPFDGSHTNNPDHKRSRIQKELGLVQMVVVEEARLSRNGDIIRKGDFPSYGLWKGIPFWEEDYNILKD